LILGYPQSEYIQFSQEATHQEYILLKNFLHSFPRKRRKRREEISSHDLKLVVA